MNIPTLLIQSYTDPIDSIIDGLHAKKLERLIDRGEELTLAKAIEIGQQYQMSQKQVRVVRDGEPPILALDPKKLYSPKKSDSHKGNPQVWQRPSARLGLTWHYMSCHGWG